MRRALLSISAVALFAIAVPSPAFASEERISLYGAVEVGAGETTGDVVVLDGEVVVDGRVDGYLVSVNAPIVIRGRVDGDVWALSEPVRLERGATVDGDIYYGDEKPTGAPGARVTGDVHSIDLDDAVGPIAFLSAIAFWLAVSLSSLVLGLVFLWFAPRAADAALVAARTGAWEALAIGLTVAIVLPIAAAVALVTLVGIPLGVALGLALVPLYALAYVTGAWLLGRAIVGEPRGRVPAFLAGWGILRLVALVPFLGTLAWLGAMVFGLGALVVGAWRAREAHI